MYQLSILIDRSERSLLRALTVVESRGFTVAAVDMPRVSTGDQSLLLSVNPIGPGRSIEVLARQLQRLQNILKVEIYQINRIGGSQMDVTETGPIYLASSANSPIRNGCEPVAATL